MHDDCALGIATDDEPGPVSYSYQHTPSKLLSIAFQVSESAKQYTLLTARWFISDLLLVSGTARIAA